MIKTQYLLFLCSFSPSFLSVISATVYSLRLILHFVFSPSQCILIARNNKDVVKMHPSFSFLILDSKWFWYCSSLHQQCHSVWKATKISRLNIYFADHSNVDFCHVVKMQDTEIIFCPKVQKVINNWNWFRRYKILETYRVVIYAF